MPHVRSRSSDWGSSSSMSMAGRARRRAPLERRRPVRGPGGRGALEHCRWGHVLDRLEEILRPPRRLRRPPLAAGRRAPSRRRRSVAVSCETEPISSPHREARSPGPDRIRGPGRGGFRPASARRQSFRAAISYRWSPSVRRAVARRRGAEASGPRRVDLRHPMVDWRGCDRDRIMADPRLLGIHRLSRARPGQRFSLVQACELPQNDAPCRAG